MASSLFAPSAGPASPSELTGGAREAAPLVSLRGVTFRYPHAVLPALRYVSFDVAEGERLLLVGPTGSGKSTVLRVLMGLIPHLVPGHLTGDAVVLGAAVAETRPPELARRGVALLAQDPAETFVADRVGAEVAFGPESLALPAADVDARVAEALAMVGLAGWERRRVRDLSGGEQQRVALAAALALRPRLLLLDEPTAHLDERTARSLLGLIDETARAHGMTIVIAEHRLGIAAKLATQAIAIAQGTVARAGGPRSVLADPRVAELGVPVPRATLAAVALGIGDPVPLDPAELAPRIEPTGARSDPVVSEAEPPEVLRFESVTFAYPGSERAAVSELTFAVGAGERVALIGPTGSGKSTVARLALGLRIPSAGRVELAGMPTRTTPVATLARSAGLVLQDPVRQLLAETIDDEILLGLGGLARDVARAHAEAAIHRFGLGDLRRRHPLTLSEGERRRVVLAATAARRPGVVVLDEPTLGQDGHQRDALAGWIRELAGGGTAFLVISHDPEFVNDACDRALVLGGGSLAADVVLGGDGVTVARAAAAGVPLADVPETVRLLATRGAGLDARGVAELIARTRPIAR